MAWAHKDHKPSIEFIHLLWYLPALEPQAFLSFVLENSDQGKGYK